MEKKKYVFYELITIAKSENIIEKICNMLESTKAVIINYTTWGEKMLAYPIKQNGINYEKGYYIQFNIFFELEHAKKSSIEIEKKLLEDSDILKIMLVPTKSGKQ